MVSELMADTGAAAPPQSPAPRGTRRRPGGSAAGISLLAHGEPQLWLTGGSLALCLVMIAGLLVLVLVAGAATFWPLPVVQAELRDGTVHLGEVTREENFPLTPELLDADPGSDRGGRAGTPAGPGPSA